MGIWATVFLSERELPMPDQATDQEVADFLCKHIDNPCEVQISSGFTANLRDFYIKEAERFLPTMTDPAAKKQLANKIKRYKP